MNAARAVRSLSFRVARLLPAADATGTVVVIVAVVAAAAAGVVFVVATGTVVGAVPGALAHGTSSPSGKRLFSAVAVAATAFVVQQVLGPVKDALAEKLGRRLDGLLRRRLMTATLAPTGIGHLEHPATLDKVALAQGVGLSHVTPGDAVIGLAENAGLYLQMIGGGCLVALFNPFLAVLLVATNLFARSHLLREAAKRVEVVTGQSEMLRRSSYFRDLSLTPGAAKEMRVFGLGPWVLERYRRSAGRVLEVMWAERKRTGAVGPLLWFGPGVVAMLASFWLLGHSATTGSASLRTLAVTAQAILVAGTWFVTDSDLLIQYGGAAVEPALEVERELATEADDSPMGEPPPAGSIRFARVGFTYPGRDEPVFDGLDLEIRRGESLAIVGRNGAGKTTIAKLLCRLYDPDAGAIYVGDSDLRTISPRAWRTRVAAIFQDFVHYELSAQANVGFGSPRRIADRSALEDAARRAGALDVIQRVGWDTTLSREYDGGVDLSGGEWQRIALARALFAVDGGAEILVLDEPTANLDVRAEAELFDALLEQTRGVTTILISHRFSTVRKADRICVLDDGRVTESGTHDELLSRDGTYAAMFKLQASPFEERSTASGSLDG